MYTNSTTSHKYQWHKYISHLVAAIQVSCKTDAEKPFLANLAVFLQLPPFKISDLQSACMFSKQAADFNRGALVFRTPLLVPRSLFFEHDRPRWVAT